MVKFDLSGIQQIIKFNNWGNWGIRHIGNSANHDLADPKGKKLKTDPSLQWVQLKDPDKKLRTKVTDSYFGSADFGLGLGLKNFPQKSKRFQIFPFWIKKISSVGSKSTQIKDQLASYLLQGQK